MQHESHASAEPDAPVRNGLAVVMLTLLNAIRRSSVSLPTLSIIALKHTHHFMSAGSRRRA
jgi:hypothetical protein